MATEPIKLFYFFRDSGHRSALYYHNPFEILVQSPNTSVADLWKSIQANHRECYNSGTCTKCPGLILVTSLWLADCKSSYDVLDDLGMRENGRLYPPEHNPRRGITFMEPGRPLSSYDLEEKRVIVEATFDFESHPDVAPNQSPRKRRRSEDLPGVGNDKRSKSEGGTTCPVYVTEPASPASAIVFPKPKSTLISWVKERGIAFIDKTGFIPVIHDLLVLRNHIGIWSPSGTAKTATLSMMRIWYDIRCPQELRDGLMKLEIGKEFQDTPAKRFERGAHLCLIFDLQLGSMLDAFQVGKFKMVFNDYLCKTLKDFVKKYYKELGIEKGDHDGFFNGMDEPLDMLTRIFKRTMIRKKTLFIGIDHFDAPLLTALTHFNSGRPVYWQHANSLLKKLLACVVGAPVTLKLLVFGQLPILRTGLQLIPGEHALQSAFWMSEKEMSVLFSAIAGDGREMDRTIMRGLEEKEVTGSSGTRYESHNFSLFLHHMAKNFDQSNPHVRPVHSPLLLSISKIQQDLILFLRRTREVAMDPILEAAACPNFYDILNDQTVVWWILYHMGVIELDHVQSDSRWHLKITTNQIIRAQLFGDDVPGPKKLDTPLDSQLRALLAGRSEPLRTAISTLLHHTPVESLSNTSEAVFQAMFDTHIKHEEQNHYFSQLSLLLNKNLSEAEVEVPIVKQKAVATKSKPGGAQSTGNQSRQPAKSEKTEDQASAIPRPKAAQGRNGYADCFSCGLDELGPRISVVLELKYLHLNGLLHGQEGRRLERSSETTQKLKALNKKIRNLSLKDLKAHKYVYWDNKGKEYVPTTVGEYFEDGKVQLHSYVSTIASGQGTTDAGLPVHQQRNGIMDPRVKIEPGNSVIQSWLVVGVGSRIVSERSKAMKSVHKYSGVKDWTPDI
ncbi:hypothetical protein B0H19DRAFT_66479 [Mycena capillaripes]|nr:hypothetical protein B0H19DRAFT_66479 [Mycena capillaripes]